MVKTDHSIPMLGADREDALIVAVQRDGKIFLDTTQVGREDLAAKIKDELKRGRPGPIYVKADARARYRSVAETVEGIRDAGFGQLALLTERRVRSTGQ